MTAGPHGFGRQCCEVGHAGPLLNGVHFLQSEDVGVQARNAIGEAVQIDITPTVRPWRMLKVTNFMGSPLPTLQSKPTAVRNVP